MSCWQKSRSTADDHPTRLDLVVDLPRAKTVGDLMPLLMARSTGHALALKNMAAVRVAVNRSYGDLKTAVAAGDEIAFFPPVTGG